MQKKSFFTLLSITCLIIAISFISIASKIYTPSQIISAINQYRSQNGLNSLSSNSTLANLAQTQAQYQASIGYTTHTGPGGTTPKDRAYAAGYGSGNTIFMSEIIYGGGNATVSTAINWWKNSSLHNSVMLDSRYLEIGAGVATGEKGTYFTAEIAWVSGYRNSDDENSTIDDSDSSPEGIPVAPIVVSSPDINGKIIHTVLEGQDLWSIAAVYDVELTHIQELNNLSPADYIFPNDKILIHSGNTPSPTETNLPTETPIPATNSPALGEPIFNEIIITNTIPPSTTPIFEIESLPSAPVGKEINLPFLLGIVFLLLSFFFILKFNNRKDAVDENNSIDVLDQKIDD